MNPIPYVVGGLVGFALLTVTYLGWHHHVYQQGYDARVAAENLTVTKAQPTIKEGELQYEDTIKKISAAPAGACNDVDPAIAAALDGLHQRSGR